MIEWLNDWIKCTFKEHTSHFLFEHIWPPCRGLPNELSCWTISHIHGYSVNCWERNKKRVTQRERDREIDSRRGRESRRGRHIQQKRERQQERKRKQGGKKYISGKVSTISKVRGTIRCLFEVTWRQRSLQQSEKLFRLALIRSRNCEYSIKKYWICHCSLIPTLIKSVIIHFLAAAEEQMKNICRIMI